MSSAQERREIRAKQLWEIMEGYSDTFEKIIYSKLTFNRDKNTLKTLDRINDTLERLEIYYNRAMDNVLRGHREGN